MFTDDFLLTDFNLIEKNELSTLEDHFFDINRIPGNGILVFPLSMSRLHLGQDPKTLYQFLCFFDKKIIEKTVDVVFIYTNGLYFNNSAPSSSIRKKSNFQMLTHKQELMRIIKKNNAFSPKTIHFLPWDYLILQSEAYLDIQSSIIKQANSDPFFKKLLQLEMKDNLDESLAHYEFIIEETVITYLIRNKLVQFPSTLSDANSWRLLFYQGRCLIPDVYLHQKQLLPQDKSIKQNDSWFHQLSSASMYNMERNILVDYNKINLNDLKRVAHDATAHTVVE